MEIWKTKWTLSCLVNDTCTWNDGAIWAYCINSIITRHMSLSLTILYSYTMLNLYSQFQLVIAVLQPLFVQSKNYLLSRCISVIFDKAFHDGHDYQTYQKSEGEHCDCNDLCKRLLWAMWPWPLSCIFNVRKDKKRVWKNEE